MSESIEKTIDIDKILKSKMGSKVKFVPRFLVSWLKKIIHEDEVNRFLWESRGLSGTEWLTECVRYLKMDVEIVGLENLPDKNDGKLYTFVSNHPLGGQDGVCLGSIIGKHYDGKFRYLVNDLLLNLPGLKPVSIGINKTGRQSRDFPRMVEAGFKSDNHMLMFPAGLNSRKRKDGTIHDLPWKKTFISKSIEYQRDVVPIHFGGCNSNVSTASPDLATSICRLISPCCSWLTRCTGMWASISASPSANRFLGRLLIRASRLPSGRSMLKTGFMNFNGLQNPGTLFYINEIVES